MRRLLLVASLAILACGITAQLPAVTPTPTASQRAITAMPSAEPSEAVNFTVCGAPSGLYVREQAGEQYSIVGLIENGAAVTVLGKAEAEDGGKWYKIGKGYVNARYICQ